MKRIVILCDGTWNVSDSQTPTNVVRLGQMLKPTDDKGISQIPIYIPGVGTGEGVTRLARFLDKTLGGSLGWGLMENVVEAYRHLVFLYEPGDEIYIFGFSRGAFTARSLTGFIRSTGILDRDKLHLMNEAVERYRKRGGSTHPSSDQSHRFRARLSPHVATSPAEVEWRKTKEMPEPNLLHITYLGVWDSVGALGIPSHLVIAPFLNRGKYEFHDADLSSVVRSARHAVALDEMRPSFEPTCWTNIDKLNKESGASAKDPAYQEKHFLGDHGSVGGGGDILDLSSIALQWIAEGAQEQGLALDASVLDQVVADQAPLGSLRNTKEPPTGIMNYFMRRGSRYRKGPNSGDQVHPSVVIRWHAKPSELPERYRPGSLDRVKDELDAMEIPDRRQS